MWEVASGISVVLVLIWVIWRRRKLSVFDHFGIPGPKPSFWFGNLWELYSKNPLVCHEEWLKKYGDIYGYYFGTEPVIVIADVEDVKRVQVYQFQKFINRPAVFGVRKSVSVPRGIYVNQLSHIRNKRWKELRGMTTPAFTISKMKTMTTCFNDCIDSLIENIEEKARNEGSFEIYSLYRAFAMDAFGRTAFGVETNYQKNLNHPFLRSAVLILSTEINSVIQLLMFSFPEFSFILAEINNLYMRLKNGCIDPTLEMAKTVKTIIRKRRENAKLRRTDLLQLLMDAQVAESDIKNASYQDLTAQDNDEKQLNNSSTINGTKTHPKLCFTMNDCEVTDNAVLFFLTGFDAPSKTLAFTTHFLLHYPEVQERVRDEVKSLYDQEGKLDYDSIQKLPYLDQVVTESLRMYPPTYLFVNREAGEDVSLGGFFIKKGMAVQIPAYHIQRSEKYWSDPNKFNPERFAQENRKLNNPFAFQAFGGGPRNCVGMKFGLICVKITLARVLLNYKLEKCEETDKLDIQLRCGATFIAPLGVKLKAIPIDG